MSETEFSKVEAESDKKMYGPRCILVCGFDVLRREAFTALLQFLALTDLPVRFCASADLNHSLADLASGSIPEAISNGEMPAAVILSGMRESELHALIDHWRGLKMPPQHWAALTPTSETWTLGTLLHELDLEAQAMRAREEFRRSQRSEASEP